MSERAVFYITGGLSGMKLHKINKPYVVVDLVALTVLDSDDKSLIGKSWKAPSYRYLGTPTGSIPPPPEAFQIALWLGLAKFTHDTIYAVMPPGLKVVVDLQPVDEKVYWYNWVMTFGELVNPNVVITHSHEPMMKKHDDPLYYSIVKHVYPLNLKLYVGKPHHCEITNNDPAFQTVEATFWYIETGEEGAELIDNLFKGLKNFRLRYLKEKMEL